MVNFSLRFDSVSLTQRAVVAECERQRSRLIQVLRWYDHQQTARNSEFRRQFEQINKETRRKINTRSQVVIKERARVKHLLDDDNDDNDNNNRPPIYSAANSRTHFQLENRIDDRKRKVYGCLLPQFKAPLSKISENWSQFKSNSTLSELNYKKSLEKQRCSINKFIEPPIEQRNRMNKIINKLVHEFEQCDGAGFDHFLRTSEPTRNARILAQQLMNEKIQKK